ncbi:MAG: FMN-binding negative transcriptional regulator [Candidatus Eremiobacteraeota bacterium]|nr:FMN-binding negative transcriptional regulator [Candidatus Eremiobacteraeota bacterium]
MYVPKAFAVEDRAWAERFIDANSFGTLVTVRDGEPFATHLPFLIEPERGPHGTLLAHMARANPHWQAFGDVPSLAIFSGPHAYVSPSWYRSAAPKVPTWNYAAVHVYGKVRLVEDVAATETLLRKLIAHAERGFDDPWTFERVDEPYRREMIHHIVAFEIPIDRIEAKAKLNQNRPEQDRRLVAEAVGGELGKMMEEVALTER